MNKSNAFQKQKTTISNDISNDDSSLSTDSFCREVTALTSNAFFCEGHAINWAPLAMLAFAGLVVDKIIRGK